jgi:hypothetical protein
MRFNDGVNSPEESYWLGFLVGDGTIYENRYRVKLSLQKSDEKHLEKFVKFLNYGKNRIHLYGSMCEVSINNKELLINLYNLGLCQNKVHKTHKGLIPKRYQQDFIRGLFDADGTIHISLPKEGKTKTADFHIYGTYNLLEGVRDVFVKNIRDADKSTGCISTSIGQPSHLEYKGRWIVDKIGHYLLDGAKVYLERKYKIYQDLFQYNIKYNKEHIHQQRLQRIRKYRRFDEKTIHEMKQLYRSNKIIQKEIAEKFNISQSFVSRVLNNKRYQNI